MDRECRLNARRAGWHRAGMAVFRTNTGVIIVRACWPLARTGDTFKKNRTSMDLLTAIRAHS